MRVCNDISINKYSNLQKSWEPALDGKRICKLRAIAVDWLDNHIHLRRHAIPVTNDIIYITTKSSQISQPNNKNTIQTSICELMLLNKKKAFPGEINGCI